MKSLHLPSLHLPLARFSRLAGCWLVMAVAGFCGPAAALSIASLSPQGEVARVRQVVAKFDEAASAAGDARAPAPLNVSCDHPDAGKGTGRWNGPREWVYEFNADLPPGVRCTVQAAAAFKPVGDKTLAGKTRFQFNTGGPFVQSMRPYDGATIEEEQTFFARLNGPATLESVKASVTCGSSSVGERIAIRLLQGSDREALLKAVGEDKAAAREPLRYLTFACNRKLASDAKVDLRFDRGLATPSGITSRTPRRFNFTVRAPFAASMSCERENAQTACLPIRPITVSFNAPVEARLARQLLLKGAAEAFKLDLGDDEGDSSEDGALVESVRFKGPFPEKANLSLELPAGLKDASGRTLANATSFPLKVAIGAMPPLAKFAAESFGIVERLAEGPGSQPTVPITLRRIESGGSQGKVAVLTLTRDADIIAWVNRLQRYNGVGTMNREDVASEVNGPLPPPQKADPSWVETRMLSLLQGRPGVQMLDLPPPPKGTPAGERPFEVVGIPVGAGFHVLEVGSELLGTALLRPEYGSKRTLFVRSSALVTNLGVHFKLGRENALAWVTTLDKGLPVAGAAVRVSDCKGNQVAQGTTDAQGIARFNGIAPTMPRCHEEGDYFDDNRGYFVSARATQGGVSDLAFVWSDWQKGIEPWRFNAPTSTATQPDLRVHTITDRALFRAGETVSMKHIIRSETSSGFGLPAQLPITLVITHEGSGQEFTQPLKWRKTATGGRSAENTFSIPPAAKLGVYSITLKGKDADGTQDMDDNYPRHSGQFRVEEFRLPVLQGSVRPEGKDALVAATQVPVLVGVNYVSGGPAGNLPVRVSASVRDKSLNFADYDEFSFDPPRKKTAASSGDGEEEDSASADQRLVADKLPVTLDKNGSGKVLVENLKPAERAQTLLLEASYADPNGEIQTLSHSATLWPAAVVAGIKTEGWASSDQTIKFQALALDLNGKPAAGVKLDVTAVAQITTTTRKRMVGGFYAYDNKTETKDLGSVCAGASDARGMLVCNAKLGQPGQIELIVTAKDAKGRASQASSSVWVTRQGELWFGGENHDRMDVLSEKKQYQPGDVAKFQVRMPFRQATALLAVEREGILHTEVVTLRGDDPTINLKIQDGWGPNVYVSVLALRGRLREVPWYSFFTWGWKAPREWWDAYRHEGKEYVPPAAMVDLSKPAFRLGMAEIRVGTQGHQLDVSVKSDKPSYPVRGKAQITITAKLPNGQPAANAEVALAAVDEALLELLPNDSWNLLHAMLQRRSWGVGTATAQMEVVGRRHYGRKAVPAGGDGGGRGAPTRELLDTLLLWRPNVQLDAQGQAQVQVPLNDAITGFAIVAVADSGAGLFGTGRTSIRSTQDLQIISGLPPLVRGGDQFNALLTLRNTTSAAMKVKVTPRVTLLNLKPQTVDLAPGQSREVQWDVTTPPELAALRAQAILWEVQAEDNLSGARDALKISQRVLPAVAVTVQQATLEQLDGSYSLDMVMPADAIAGRGGIKLALQAKLADGLPGVRDWFIKYPFACLEQKASKSIGLRDKTLWAQTAAVMPNYLDGDGLANYFPPQAGSANNGSDTLTAWLLAATHEAAQIDPAFAIPDNVRADLIKGLTRFVEGKIERKFWSPRQDLGMRKLSAIEALARHGAAKPAMLTSITIAPNQWPTHAVIDWLSVLQRVKGIANRDQLLAQAQQVLRTRLSYQGTKAVFSTEKDDYWWWLMTGGDVNMARLLLTVMNDPAWKDDLGRIASGFIGRQQRGAWATTTANLWGGMALERFSKTHENMSVTGLTRATLGAATAQLDWRKVTRPAINPAAQPGFAVPDAPGAPEPNTMMLSWGDQKPGAAPRPLTVTHEGGGKPWLTVQALAAVELKAPFAAGYQIKKTVTPIEQANKNLPAGQYSRGDVLRIKLDVTSSADMTWVVLTDPVPGGATILGSGLGRDSSIATQDEKRSGSGWPVFEERSFEAFRSYYDYLPKGRFTLEYTLRLNNPGNFAQPPTRVEALYAPEVFGEAPNPRVKVVAGP